MRGRRWISSTKKTLRGSSAVRNEATSPLRSSAGPAVGTQGTSSSLATIWASDVLPSPGGPASSTWSSASPRPRAASMATGELLLEHLLADEVLQAPRPQRAVELVLGHQVGRLDARLAHFMPSGYRVPSGYRTTLGEPAAGVGLAQRVGDELLGRVAVGPGQQPLCLGGVVAQLEQAVARQQSGVVAAAG